MKVEGDSVKKVRRPSEQEKKKETKRDRIGIAERTRVAASWDGDKRGPMKGEGKGV